MFVVTFTKLTLTSYDHLSQLQDWVHRTSCNVDIVTLIMSTLRSGCVFGLCVRWGLVFSCRWTTSADELTVCVTAVLFVGSDNPRGEVICYEIKYLSELLFGVNSVVSILSLCLSPLTNCPPSLVMCFCCRVPDRLHVRPTEAMVTVWSNNWTLTVCNGVSHTSHTVSNMGEVHEHNVWSMCWAAPLSCVTVHIKLQPSSKAVTKGVKYMQVSSHCIY